MSDIELPDLPPPHRHGGTYESAPFTYYTAEQMRAYAIADREKRAQAAQPHAYAVYFPDQQREELVHDLDELLDDLTNYEHTVTPLFATEASKPVQACEHQFHYFGDQQKRRRCNRCNELEPVQAEAPNHRPSPEWYQAKIAETLDDDFIIGPATKQAEAPTASNERDTWRGGSSYEASLLRNLLARIHGDGGHYLEQHGLDKTVEDADQLVSTWRAALATQQAEAPTASNEREEQTRWLNKLLNDFAKACAFSDDNLARMVAANEIHELFNRAALATQPTASNAGERDITDLIQQRDHREEIIDQLCDAVLGFDRPEWSSAYYFEDAVTAVNERMEWIDQRLENQASNAAQAEPAGGDKEDADKYRLIRRGQHWSVIDGIGNTLRGDDLDAAVDAIRAARAAQQATGQKGGA